jgi:hypothetical protein
MRSQACTFSVEHKHFCFLFFLSKLTKKTLVMRLKEQANNAVVCSEMNNLGSAMFASHPP